MEGSHPMTNDITIREASINQSEALMLADPSLVGTLSFSSRQHSQVDEHSFSKRKVCGIRKNTVLMSIVDLFV